MIRGLVRRFVPAKRTPEWWAMLTRPRHLFRRRQSTAIPAGPAPSRQRRYRLWPWLVGGPLVLLLAVAFGTGVYLGRMVNHRLAAAIAAADRDDPYWRIDDLMAHREPVPDAENSALVVAEVLALLPENWPRARRPARDAETARHRGEAGLRWARRRRTTSGSTTRRPTRLRERAGDVRRGGPDRPDRRRISTGAGTSWCSGRPSSTRPCRRRRRPAPWRGCCRPTRRSGPTTATSTAPSTRAARSSASAGRSATSRS